MAYTPAGQREATPPKSARQAAPRMCQRPNASPAIRFLLPRVETIPKAGLATSDLGRFASSSCDGRASVSGMGVDFEAAG